MFAKDNDDFLKQLAEEFPDEDWDNLPELDSIPDIWTLCIHWKKTWRGGDLIGGLGSEEWEFETKELAEAHVEQMRQRDDAHKVDFDSINISREKPFKGFYKNWCKETLERVNKGEKVFPIYLP